MGGFTTATQTKTAGEYGSQWSDVEDDHETDFEEDQNSPMSSELSFSSMETPVDDTDSGGPVIQPLPTAFKTLIAPNGDQIEDDEEVEEEEVLGEQTTDVGTLTDTDDEEEEDDSDDPTVSDTLTGTGDEDPDEDEDDSDTPDLGKALGEGDDQVGSVGSTESVNVTDTGTEKTVSGSSSAGVTAGSTSVTDEDTSVDTDTASETQIGVQKEDGGGASGASVTSIQFGTPEAPIDPILTDIWALKTGSTPDEQAAYAEARFGEVTQAAADNQALLSGHATTLKGQVEAGVAARVAQVTTAYDAAVGAVQGQFSGLRGQVAAAVDAALKAIAGEASRSVGVIDGALSTQLGTLTTGFDKAEADLEAARSNGIAQFTKEWEGRVKSVRDAGDKKAQQAMGIAKGLAKGWTGGDGIEAERNDARRKAALDVGKKFATEIKQKANQAADSFAGGAKHIPDAVNELVKPVTDQVAQARIDSVTALNDSAAQAKAEVERQATDARAQIRRVGQQASDALTAQETDAVGALTTARDQANAALQTTGESLSAQITGASETLASTYGEALAQLQELICLGDPPPTADTDAAVAAALDAFGALRDQQMAAMNDSLTGGLAEMDTTVQGAVEAAGATRDQIIEASSEAGAQSVQAIQSASTKLTGAIKTYTSGATKQLADIATRAVEGAQRAVQGAISAISQTQTAWIGDLDKSKATVVGELDTTVGKVQGEVQSAAGKAAAEIKEKSWWEKAWDVIASVAAVLVSIIVAIVVFVAVAAFIIGTFGAGAVVLIAAGAVAGAVAGVASKLAGDATKSLLTWSNQFSSGMDYLQAGIVGAVGGGLTMGLAGVVGPIANATIGSFGGALADQLTDMGLFGEAWSWGEFFAAGALGTVLGAAGSKFFPKSLGPKLTKFLLPGGRTGNSWNSFQSLCKSMPILKNLTTQERGVLWKQIVSGKIDGTPEELVSKPLEEIIKMASPDELNLDDNEKKAKKIEDDKANDLKEIEGFKVD